MVVLSEETGRVEMTGMETFNIQHRTSNIQRKPKARHWMFGVGCWMFDVLKFSFTPLLALQLLAAGASAADKLQADLIPLGLRARNEAPIHRRGAIQMGLDAHSRRPA